MSIPGLNQVERVLYDIILWNKSLIMGVYIYILEGVGFSGFFWKIHMKGHFLANIGKIIMF